MEKPPTSLKDQKNKLFKVRYLIKYFHRVAGETFTFGREITLDEAMIKCRSLFVGFLQYNPAKPIKCGIKSFMVCSADGTIIGFHIYQGRGKGKSTVMDLLVDDLIPLLGSDGYSVQGKGHTLYVDNWYTSISVSRIANRSPQSV